MHTITWTSKTDSWGRPTEESDWYQQSWKGWQMTEVLYRLKRLKMAEEKGYITNIKHVFEE